MNTIDKALTDLTVTAQYKLNLNEHKSCHVLNPNGDGRRFDHFNDDDLPWLFERVEGELKELKESLFKKDKPSLLLGYLRKIYHLTFKKKSAYDRCNAIYECGDVTNFIAIIHSILIKGEKS